jgi:hypothetical protein
MAASKPRAPGHPSPSSKRIWRRIATEFDLYGDDAGLVVLGLAMGGERQM